MRFAGFAVILLLHAEQKFRLEQTGQCRSSTERAKQQKGGGGACFRWKPTIFTSSLRALSLIREIRGRRC